MQVCTSLQTDNHSSTPPLTFLQARCPSCRPTNSIKALKAITFDSINDTHTCPFNGPLSRTTRVSRYQKGKTNLDFTGARDSERQQHQMGHMQVCSSLQIDNHASTPPLSFLQAGCPSCHPTNSVKALKASTVLITHSRTHTHPFNGPISGTTRVSRTRKVKPIWILLKQETVSGSGISWAHASLHLAPDR